jgi:hypothetical protein
MSGALAGAPTFSFVEWRWESTTDPFVFQRIARIRGDCTAPHIHSIVANHRPDGHSVIPGSGLLKTTPKRGNSLPHLFWPCLIAVIIPFSRILNISHFTTLFSSDLIMAVVKEGEKTDPYKVKTYNWRLRGIPSHEAVDAWVTLIKNHVSLRLGTDSPIPSERLFLIPLSL